MNRERNALNMAHFILKLTIIIITLINFILISIIKLRQNENK